jgi:hypothetical protein
MNMDGSILGIGDPWQMDSFNEKATSICEEKTAECWSSAEAVCPYTHIDART